MKKERGFILLSLFLCNILFSQELFDIQYYQVMVDGYSSNKYFITETIDVNFFEQRQGIIRTIPFFFNEKKIKITDIKVPGYNSKITKSDGNINIRIGTKGRYVYGNNRYTISYYMEIGKDAYPDMDELYLNLIGNQWNTTIHKAEFTINMPFDFDASKISFTSGEFGSTNRDNVDFSVTGKTINAGIINHLNEGEGVTIALPLPEGYWRDARNIFIIGDFFYFLAGHPFYILILTIVFIIWLLKGRNERIFPAVEFAPPGNMNPSEAGYITDGRLDSYDITTLIIYWASKGNLEIIEEEAAGFFKLKEIYFVKLKNIDEKAPSYEKYMFKKLFSKAGSDSRVRLSSLKYDFHEVISEVDKRIKQAVKNRNIYEKSSVEFQYLTGAIAFLPVLSLFFDVFMKDGSSVGEGFVGVSFSVFLVLPLMVIAYMTALGKGMRKSTRISAIIGCLFPLLMATALIFSMIEVKHGCLYMRYIISAVCSFLSFLFVFQMKKRTKNGNKIYEKLEGFKEFIKTAEKEKLELMLDENPSYFYDILPYAIVFGLTQKWASHFDSLLLSPPDWYRGERYERFNPIVFTSNMNSIFSNINSVLNSKPSSSDGSGSSSSSSSGGSSGGGAGGGGGSSW